MFFRICSYISAILIFAIINSSELYSLTKDKEVQNELNSLQDSLRYYYRLSDKYIYEGQFMKSKIYCIKHLNLLKQYFPENKSDLSLIYIKLGVIHSNFWEFKQALSWYNSAEKLCNEDVKYNHEILAKISYNKGKIYKKLGDYKKAEQHYMNSLNLLESKNIIFSDLKDKNISIILIYNSLGVLHFELKEYKEALIFFKKNAVLSNINYKEFLPVAYENIAECYFKIKLFNEAEKYFKLALKYHLTGEKYEYKYLLASVYSCYSQLCLEKGHYDQAYNLLRNAYSIYIKYWGKAHPETSECLLNFGKYFEKTKNLDSALYYYQKSIICLTDDFSDISIYANPSPDKVLSPLHLINSLKHKANALSSYYNNTQNIKDLESSLNAYDIAVQLVDKIRLGYQTQESKLFLSENEKSTYTNATYTAYRLLQITGDEKYVNKAFEYTERSKAAVLLSALRTSEARIFAGIPDTLLQLENNLLKDIALYEELIREERINEKPEENKLKNWEQKLFTVTAKYDNLITSFEDCYPKYYSLKYNTKVTNMEKLQDNLSKQEAIIEYMLTDTVLYSFLITRHNTKFIAQSINQVFHKDIEYLKYYLQNYYDTNDKLYSQIAFSLYKKLIQPFESSIIKKKLIIVPDSNLGFVPFESLLYRPLNTEYSDYAIYPYLLKKYSISYAYSGTLFLLAKYKNKTYKNKFLAIAPGYKTSKDSLKYLPLTVKEAKLLAKMTKGDALYENKATEYNFKSKINDYNIIHLTMHAINNNNEPMLSKLAFTDNKDINEDGYLYAYEIYNIKLKADLVVLSACNTGKGKLYRGEGIYSIARSFLHAGSNSVIMSLWQSGDETSFKILLYFYKYLLKGKRKDFALRQAKLKYLENSSPSKAHPSLWAGYVLLGDPLEIYKKKIFLIYVTVLVSIIVIFIGIAAINWTKG